MKTFIELLSHLLHLIPPLVVSVITNVLLIGYFIIDYYVLDLTPAIGSYYSIKLGVLEDKIESVENSSFRIEKYLLEISESGSCRLVMTPQDSGKN